MKKLVSLLAVTALFAILTAGTAAALPPSEKAPAKDRRAAEKAGEAAESLDSEDRSDTPYGDEGFVAIERPAANYEDPVCGSLVDSDTPYRTEYKGVMIGFDSQGCMNTFLADPGRYEGKIKFSD